MKLTKQQLKQLIKEELQNVLQEQSEQDIVRMVRSKVNPGASTFARALTPQPGWKAKPKSIEDRLKDLEDCVYDKKCRKP